jgi:hypothetical protein
LTCRLRRSPQRMRSRPVARPAVICVHCGTNLMSGARIRTEASHDPIARKTSEREEIEADETRPFWRLTLGTVGKPGVTFASMPIQLSNPVMIAKMLVFYLLSVVIYALLASRGFAATPKDLPLGVIVIVMFAPVEFFINALLVNLGARMWMGSKGNFLLFLVVMSFATAVVNFGSVPLVLITPLIGAKTTSATMFVFAIWRAYLYYKVLTNIYDADFMEALAIVVIAWMIQWFLTMWLFASILMLLSNRFQG